MRWKTVSSESIITVAVLVCSIYTAESYTDSNTMCKGWPDGIHHADDCYHYTICYLGQGYLRRCSSGMVFDNRLRKCLDVVRFPCRPTSTISVVGRRCRKEGHLIASRVSCKEFLVCQTGLYGAIPCPPGMLFSKRTYKCTTPDLCMSADWAKYLPKEKKAENPYNGICDNSIGNVSEPLHCTLFISCSFHPQKHISLIQVMACEPELLFSTESRRCERPDMVICGSRFRNVAFHGIDPNPSLVQQLKLMTDLHTTENPVDSIPPPFARELVPVERVAPDSSQSTTGGQVQSRDPVIIEFRKKYNGSDETLLFKLEYPLHMRNKLQEMRNMEYRQIK